MATHTQEFHDGGFYDGDGPATEIERDEHGFPEQPDVPSTVVSEDDGPSAAHGRHHNAFANSFDEVPPNQGISALPNDAPTVVRPDLAGMSASPANHGFGAPPKAVSDTTADAMQAYADQPAGEPTVALPPPSQRKQTSVKQPSPEPAHARSEELPSGASYSPPADTPPPARKARSENRSDSRKRSKRDSDRRDKKKRDKSASRPPPSKSAKSVKKPPAPGEKKSRSDRGEGRKKLPKNASVVGEDPSAGIPMLYYVYGGVGIAGVALVAGAVVVAVIILAVTSA